jgi:hypothetical protein
MDAHRRVIVAGLPQEAARFNAAALKCHSGFASSTRPGDKRFALAWGMTPGG